MTLDRNPDNFFAETEQAAFHVGNMVPGVDLTNDPLLQARLFSYLDTQLTRLGGPNFAQIPINRPIVPVRNHQQDGMHQHAIPTAPALYHPNSVAAGNPMLASRGTGYEHLAERVEGAKIRARSTSFGDHFSQARMFFHSQSVAERRHLVDACCFEVSKVVRPEIRERCVQLFNQIDGELAREVAKRAGVPPEALDRAPVEGSPRRDAPSPPVRGKTPKTSPALSMKSGAKGSIRTRVVAVLVADGVRGNEVAQIGSALAAEGAGHEVVAPRLGAIATAERGTVAAQKTLQTVVSVLYDAVYVPGGAESVAALMKIPEAMEFVREGYRHAKTIGATSEGAGFLDAAGIAAGPGIVAFTTADGFTDAFVGAMKQHRHFARGESPPAR